MLLTKYKGWEFLVYSITNLTLPNVYIHFSVCAQFEIWTRLKINYVTPFLMLYLSSTFINNLKFLMEQDTVIKTTVSHRWVTLLFINISRTFKTVKRPRNWVFNTSHSLQHHTYQIILSYACMHACVCAGCIGPSAYFTSAITVKISGDILGNYARVAANLILMNTDSV